MRVVILLLVIFTVCVSGFVGCGGNKEGGFSPFLSDDGTGVRGLDTPDQILNNPYVEDALDAASGEGVNITPEMGVNPPVISGTYDLTGEACVPGHTDWHQIASGTWRWFNQTSDNYVDTEYDQLGTQTGSGGGEIIRGTGNRFTVYSVLYVSDIACEERAVMIVDGEQHNDGSVSAVYIITPAQDPDCHATTVGLLELELTGAPKIADTDGCGVLPIMVLKASSQGFIK